MYSQNRDSRGLFLEKLCNALWLNSKFNFYGNHVEGLTYPHWASTSNPFQSIEDGKKVQVDIFDCMLLLLGPPCDKRVCPRFGGPCASEFSDSSEKSRPSLSFHSSWRGRREWWSEGGGRSALDYQLQPCDSIGLRSLQSFTWYSFQRRTLGEKPFYSSLTPPAFAAHTSSRRAAASKASSYA